MLENIEKIVQAYEDEDIINKYYDIVNNVKFDYQNLQYIAKYILEEQNEQSIIEAVENYLKENFNIDDVNKIDITVLKELSDIHINNFDICLSNFYNIYNSLIDSVELISTCKSDEQLSNCIENMMSLLKIFSDIIFTTSDFFLNYCAIIYIRRKDINKIDLKILEKNNITMPLLDIYYILSVKTEFTYIMTRISNIITEKLTTEQIDEKCISLYNSKFLVKQAIKIGLNRETTKMVNLLEDNCINYEIEEVTIACLSYYCALWYVILLESKYGEYFDQEIEMLFYDVADELSEHLGKNIYEELYSSYKKAKKVLLKNKDKLSSEEAMESFCKSLTKDKIVLGKDSIKFFFVENIKEIRDYVK